MLSTLLATIVTILGLVALVVGPVFVWKAVTKGKTTLTSYKAKSKAWVKNRKWHLGAVGITMLFIIVTTASIVDWIKGPSRDTTPEQSTSTTTGASPSSTIQDIIEKTVTIKPGEPVEIQVPPNYELEWWGDVRSSWEWKGSSKLVTLSSDKEVEITYRLSK